MPVTSHFGYRQNPMERGRDRNLHKGTDIDCEVGDSVFAWRSGYVSWAGYNRLAGNAISIKHPDAYLSKYQHLHRILVEDGEEVAAGQLIALAGRTGRATGSHLHFSIMKDGAHTDPYPYLRASAALQGPVPALRRKTIVVHKEIVIRSYPADVDIYVDDDLIGRSPLKVKLPYGAYHIAADGGRDYGVVSDFFRIDAGSDGIIALQLAGAGRGETPPVVAGRDPRTGASPPGEGLNGVLLGVRGAAYREPLAGMETGSGWGIHAGISGKLQERRFLGMPAITELRFVYETVDLTAASADSVAPFTSARLWAGALGHYWVVALSSELRILLGGELLVGERRLRADPAAGGETGTDRSELLFSSLAGGGLRLAVAPHWWLDGRYGRTLATTGAAFSEVRVSILRGF